MNHASLFSGIGGFDLAAREVGWNNVFQCEIDPFCQSVLKYYFPKTVLYEDIKRTDFTSWKGKIDVLTGGFPCQPFSVAGQRKGADDNRYLWPEIYFTDAGIECTPEECKLIESLNRLAKKWEKDGKRLWLYSASGVLTVMMHGDREDNPIPEMLPNAGTNPDNIITTISGIGNDGGDW